MTGKRKAGSWVRSEPEPKIRRVDSTSNREDQDAPDQPSDPQTSASLAPLTKENLRRWVKMTSSAGQQTAASTPSASKTGSTTSSRKTKSTTDTGFPRQIAENGLHDVVTSEDYPPANEAEILAYFTRSRDSASPSPSQHAVYKTKIQENSNERELENHLQCHIFQKTDQISELFTMNYRAKFDKQWVDFPSGVGFNNGCSAPKPDLVEGFLETEFPDIIYQIGGAATLVKAEKFIAFPHFAAENKDYGKNMRQAEVQACYDGAAMVYSRNRALALMGQSDPPRHASVVTVATNGRDWKVYAHYALNNDKTGRLEYYQYLLDCGELVKYSHNKIGRKIIRNIQDWGREQAADLKDRLWRFHNSQNNARSVASAGRSGVNAGKRSVPATKNGAPSTSSTSPSLPSPRVKSGTNKNGGGKAAQNNQAMLPPPSRSSDASGVRDADRNSRRDPKIDQPRPQTDQKASPSRSIGLVPRTPASWIASVASSDRRPSQSCPVPGGDGNGHLSPIASPSTRRPSDIDHKVADSDGNDRSAERRGRPQDPYRSYRDRSDGKNPPFAKRRTASPVRGVKPRQQNSEPDRGRRDERSEQGSVSDSSKTSNTKSSSDTHAVNITKICKEPPRIPKGASSTIVAKPQLARP